VRVTRPCEDGFMPLGPAGDLDRDAARIAEFIDVAGECADDAPVSRFVAPSVTVAAMPGY